MKTEVKKIDGTKKEISIEVNGDVVRNKFDGVFNKIAKEAKVPGFRVGRAPRDVIEKRYSSHAYEQVLKELIPDIYNQVIEKEGLDVLELPCISDVKLDRNSLSFKAQVETRPEIAVKNYKGIKINYKKINVSPDEIKRSIDALKESRHAQTIDDNFAKSLGYPDLAELEKAMERQVCIQKENLERQKIEMDIAQTLIKDLDFKVPQTLINRQLEDLVRQAKLDLALKGLAREEIEEQEKTLSKELEPQAEKQVKVYLVMAEIAKKENITLDDHMPRRVMEFLLKEAKWNNVESGE